MRERTVRAHRSPALSYFHDQRGAGRNRTGRLVGQFTYGHRTGALDASDMSESHARLSLIQWANVDNIVVKELSKTMLMMNSPFVTPGSATT